MQSRREKGVHLRSIPLKVAEFKISLVQFFALVVVKALGGGWKKKQVENRRADQWRRKKKRKNLPSMESGRRIIQLPAHLDLSLNVK